MSKKILLQSGFDPAICKKIVKLNAGTLSTRPLLLYVVNATTDLRPNKRYFKFINLDFSAINRLLITKFLRHVDQEIEIYISSYKRSRNSIPTSDMFPCKVADR